MVDRIAGMRPRLNGQVILQCPRCKLLHFGSIYERNGYWYLETDRHVKNQMGRAVHSCGGRFLIFGSKRRIFVES